MGNSMNVCSENLVMYTQATRLPSRASTRHTELRWSTRKVYNVIVCADLDYNYNKQRCTIQLL